MATLPDPSEVTMRRAISRLFTTAFYCRDRCLSSLRSILALPRTHEEEETVVKDKSVGAALVLTFLFGPLGIFYVSILWAVVFIVLAIVVAVLTLGLGLLLVWPASMILAAITASNQHSRYQAWLAGGRS